MPLATELQENKYDFVLAFEVLEHLLNPREEISKISKTLKENGILILTTGNLTKHKGPVADWYYAKIPDVHISFFTKQSTDILFNELGLKNLKKKLAPEIIQYKIINTLPAKKILVATRKFWKFFVPLVDKKHGVSIIAFWQRGSN